MTLILFVVAIDRSIYTTTVTYGYRCGRTINTTCCVNDTGDIHTCSLSSSLFSSISCLFIDIVLIVSFRGISCCLDNRYFGHNSHLLLHYKKKKKRENRYCCVKICFTSATTLYGL